MIAWWTEIKLLFSLLFVVVVAYVAIRMLGRKSARLSTGAGPIRSVAALPLGSGKTLQVVVVDRRTVLLLGIAANVECVARFDDPDLARQLLAEVESGGPSFLSRIVSAWWRKRQAPHQSVFANLLRDRLRGGENGPVRSDEESRDRPDGVSEGDDG